MKGSFSVPHRLPRATPLVLVLMIVLVLGSGFYFIGQKFRATKTVSSLTTGDWIAFSPERLEPSSAAGRTVFVDFTAAWCIPASTKPLSSRPRVKSAFERYGVVKMKADWTNADPVIQKL